MKGEQGRTIVSEGKRKYVYVMRDNNGRTLSIGSLVARWHRLSGPPEGGVFVLPDSPPQGVLKMFVDNDISSRGPSSRIYLFKTVPEVFVTHPTLFDGC